jgi:hypothetical protein
MNGDRGNVASAPYARQIGGHRRQWLEDELRRRKAGETIALCERLLRQSDDGETRFFLGEAYRLRAGEGDGTRALAEYALVDGAWNQYAIGLTRKSEVWTLDGLPLDRLVFFVGIADGEALAELAQRKDRQIPKFRASIQAHEVVEF